MKALLKILYVLIVLTGVLMKSGDVYVRTVGETVEIKCPYSDDHKYTPRYFCRHPCKTWNHVLISSGKTDQTVSDGRYSLIDIVSGRTFTVYIKHLRLTDSGVYYCGLSQWFSDTLKKVTLSVRPAASVNRSTNTSENTHVTSIWTTALTLAVTSSQQTNDQRYNNTLITIFNLVCLGLFVGNIVFIIICDFLFLCLFLLVSLTDKSSSYEQFSATSPTVQSKGPLDKNFKISIPVVCAGVLVLLAFCVLVALVSLCRKRSDLKSKCLKPPVPENPVQESPDQAVGVVYHLYDEIVTEYSLAGAARDCYSSVIYSTVQHCDLAPQNEVNALYSLIKHH